MDTGYWIEQGLIRGPKESGLFFVADQVIYGPRHSGEYWIMSDVIYGPRDSGQFYVRDGRIMGPSVDLPWMDPTETRPHPRGRLWLD